MEIDCMTEAGAEAFAEDLADQARKVHGDGIEVEPVAFIMTAECPAGPVVMALAQLPSPSLYVDAIKSVMTRFNAYGVFVALAANRVSLEDKSAEHVFLIQLDHRIIGARAWQAVFSDEGLGELQRIPSPHRGSFCNLIAAEDKAN